MKCIKCEKPATKRFSPDLDIKGIGTCDEHEDEIRIDLLLATCNKDGWEKFDKKYFGTSKQNSK